VCSSLQPQSHNSPQCVSACSYTLQCSVVQSTATISPQRTVCSSLQLQSHYSASVFQSTATITLQCTVCSSLELKAYYSAQCVPIYSHNHTTVHSVFHSTATSTLQCTGCSTLQSHSSHGTRCRRLRNLQLGVWPNYLLGNVPTSFVT
jgi:hypothetical protein